MSFKSFMEEEGLLFAADRLHYFSHWITPVGLPIRYNVRFFVMEAPPGQEASHDDRELTGHVWISPEKALALFGRGQFNMVLPTMMTLRELGRFKTIEEALKCAEEKNVTPILTKMKKIRGDYVEVMPDESEMAPLS
jgi:hypothetical protein